MKQIKFAFHELIHFMHSPRLSVTMLYSFVKYKFVSFYLKAAVCVVHCNLIKSSHNVLRRLNTFFMSYKSVMGNLNVTSSWNPLCSLEIELEKNVLIFCVDLGKFKSRLLLNYCFANDRRLSCTHTNYDDDMINALLKWMHFIYLYKQFFFSNIINKNIYL